MQQVAAVVAIICPAPQGEDDAEPEGNLPEPHAGFSNGKRAQWLHQVAAIGKLGHAGNAVGKLRRRFPLAQLVCRNDYSLCYGQLAESRYQELAEDDEDGRPERAEAGGGQVDECCTYQNLICQRVNQFAEVGHHVVFASQVAIEKISDGSYNKCPECNAGSCGNRLELMPGHFVDVRRNATVPRHGNGVDDDEDDAGKRDGIRQI